MPLKMLLRFKPQRKLLSICVIFLVTLLFILSVEGLFYILNRLSSDNTTREWSIDEGFFQFSETMGYKPPPECQATAIHKVNGTLVYKATYTIDEYSRRVTPTDPGSMQDRFILFFGGSFTFGEGVAGTETLPFFCAQFAPRYRPYNYGFLGYGPQQMLEHLKKESITDEVTEDSGIAVYTFIDSHIKRAVGSMHVYSGWGDNMPYYDLAAGNLLVRKGSFRKDRPVVSLLYTLLSKSQVVRYLHLDFPKIRAYHFRLTAKIIEASRDIFKEKFNSDDFYVIIYPGSYYGRTLAGYLKKAGIKYVDCKSTLNPNDPEFYIDEHRHPSAKAYRIMAEKLTAEIGIHEPPSAH